jgi:Big-like domain-containing protein
VDPTQPLLRLAKWRLAVIVVLLGALALPVRATAHQKPRPTPSQQIATAQRQVLKLGKVTFAPRQRSKVLGALRNSRTALRRHRACAAIAAIDNGHSLLLTDTTWRKRRIPRAVSRTIVPGLAKAEGKLVDGARRCATPAHKISTPGPILRGGANLVPVPTASTTNTQGDDEADAGAAEAGPYRPRGNAGAPSSPAPDPQLSTNPLSPGPSARTADAGPLTLFRSSNLGLAPRSGGEPKEMTTAVGHNVAWYTGNTSAGYSLDGGKNWTTVDPSTILPDPTNNPLCCDQQVIYAPSVNLFIWVLQYWCPRATPAATAANPTPSPTNDCSQINGSNVIRFAFATPEDIRTQANAGHVGFAWRTYDFTPQQAGQSSANAWFDYSTLSVNDWYANWTVDIFEGRDKALAMRINLHSLTQNKFQAEGIFPNVHTAAAQQPPGEVTSYFASNNSYSQTRVYDWRTNSSNAIIHDVDHASIPVNNGAILGSDGNDWNARAGGGLRGQTLSAAQSKNKIVVANMGWRDQCTDKCNTAKPTLTHVHDHTSIDLSRIDTNTWKSDDSDIWSNTLNYSWPSLGVARSGAFGISFLGSADNANPRPIAGFLDDGQYVYAFGGGGPQPGVRLPAPATGFSGGTGDYYSLQPGSTYESFVMPIRSIDTDSLGATSDNWRFIEYGHGSPPSASPPFVSIIAPTDGQTFTQGTPITFRANVSDNEDGEIPDYAIKWAADGSDIGGGRLITYSLLSVGTHHVAVGATDSNGATTVKLITVTIAPAAPTAPIVRITQPTSGNAYTATGNDAQGDYVDVALIGQASDPQAKPLTISWSDSHIEGGVTEAPVSFATNTLTPTVRLYVRQTNCGAASHDITLTAANGGQSSSSTIRLTVISALCVK